MRVLLQEQKWLKNLKTKAHPWVLPSKALKPGAVSTTRKQFNRWKTSLPVILLDLSLFQASDSSRWLNLSETLPGSLAVLRVSQKSLLFIYTWGVRGVVYSVGGFLKLWVVYFLNLMSFPGGWNVLSSFRTSGV